jgi:hypothetical protein
MATIEQIIININRTPKDANIPKGMREVLELKKVILENKKTVLK